MPSIRRKRRLPSERRYVLKLYVAGASRRSQTAIYTLTSVCKGYPTGCIDLEILDVYQSPILAGDAGIQATPTLVKELPLPASRLVGNLSESKSVLKLLGLKTKAARHG